MSEGKNETLFFRGKAALPTFCSMAPGANSSTSFASAFCIAV